MKLIISFAFMLVVTMFSRGANAQGWAIGMPFDSNMSDYHNSIIFGSSEYGYAWGSPEHFRNITNEDGLRLFKTTDSGLSWTRIPLTVALGGDPPLWWDAPDSMSLYFFNVADAFEEDQFTVDGGESWSTGWPSSRGYRYAAMFNRTKGIFDTDSSADPTFVNAGATFVSYDSSKTLTDPRTGGDYFPWLNSGESSFVGDWSDTTHWCYAIYQNVRDDSMSELPILFTTNGGFYWTAVVPDTSVHHHVEYKQVAFLRGTPTVYVVAQDSFVSFYRSNDYGATWHGSSAFASVMGKIAISKIVPVTPSEAWALASTYNGNVSLGRQYMLHTTDTGATWQIDSETFNGYYAADMCFLDPHHGWVLLNKDTTVIISGYPYQIDSVALVARYTSPDTTQSLVKTMALPENTRTITAYPDPAGDQIKIEMPNNDAVQQFRIYDVVEREFIPPLEIAGNELTLDVRALPAGTYYIRIDGKSGAVYAARFSKR